MSVPSGQPPPLDPQFLKWLQHVRVLFHYELPAEDRAPFLKFHGWLTNPQPKFVTQWRQAESKWYQRLVNGVLGDAQQSYAAALYHADNLRNFERAAIDVAKRLPIRLQAGSVTATSTPKIDFEYQAVVLAWDRYFEHFTLGLNAFFRDPSHDFENFGRALRHRTTHPVALALAEVYDRFRPRFEDTFSKGSHQSVRSRIMHRESVSAGCLNIHSDGHIYFAGGGENLTHPNAPGGGKPLVDVIAERFNLMREYTTAIIDAFVPSARAWDAAS
jgi:hypothetical protein